MVSNIVYTCICLFNVFIYLFICLFVYLIVLFIGLYIYLFILFHVFHVYVIPAYIRNPLLSSLRLVQDKSARDSVRLLQPMDLTFCLQHGLRG